MTSFQGAHNRWRVVLSLMVIVVVVVVVGLKWVVWGQTNSCPRPDLSPAPTPMVSQQPLLAEVETALSLEGDKHHWPDWVLKSIAKQESGWRQVDRSQDSPTGCEAREGETACTCVSESNDYGLMQLNWTVHSTWLDWEQVQTDYTYNIEKGAEILASSVVTVDVNRGDLSPTGDPIEQYLRLWAYNGYSNENNPGNGIYLRDRNWDGNKRIACRKKDINYPYQELILYAAKCNPIVDSISWQAIGDFPLPDDVLFTDDLANRWGPTRDILIFETAAQVNCLEQRTTFAYTLPTTKTVTSQITIKDDGPWNKNAGLLKTLPVNQNQWDGTDETGQPLPPGLYWFTVAVSNTHNQLIGLQTNPVSIACNPLYLPLFLKNYPPLYFFETFNPLQSGWHFYNNDPDNDVDDYIYIISTDGQDDTHSLLMTEQIGLLSFTSGGYYTVTLSPPANQVSLSFWVKRVGDYGAYRVLVDNAIVVSEQSTAATWHQHRVDVSTAATDGELHLHFQVPSQLLGQTVLFDNIRVMGP